MKDLFDYCKFGEFDLNSRIVRTGLWESQREKSGNLIGVKAVDENNEVMIITTEGIIIRLMVNGISVLGRNTSGVKLINVDTSKDISVASFAKVRESESSTSENLIETLEKEFEEESKDDGGQVVEVVDEEYDFNEDETDGLDRLRELDIDE